MTVDKAKLLAWIDIRLNDHKQKVNLIYERNDGDKPKFFEGNDRKEYDYHTGASAELVFLRQCIEEYKSFDIIPEEDLTKVFDLDGAINEYFKKG